MQRIEPDQLDLKEKVVHINRVAKVVKGGRRFSLSALVVVGDGNGHVGVGLGKGSEVPIAIRKAVQRARKSMFEVPVNGSTIPHQIVGHYGAGRVLLKPASEGTGIIAGGPVRAVVELAGIKDILTKCLGSTNAINMVRATVEGLQSLKSPVDVARSRDLAVEDLPYRRASNDTKTENNADEESDQQAAAASKDD